MDLNKKQKDLFSQKILDFGILSMITLSFGSLLSGKTNWILFSIGVLIFILSGVISYSLSK